MKKLILCAMLSGFAIACSSDSNDSPAASVTYTAGGAALKVVTDALAGSEGVISPSLAPASKVPVVTKSLAGGLSAKWEVAGSYPNPKYDSGTAGCTSSANITLKEYMGTQFDRTEMRCNGSAINIFGRLDNAGGILCVVMNSLDASTSAELATAADKIITLDETTKADLATKCPMIATGLTQLPTNTQVTMSFSAPSDTSAYDLKISVAPFNNEVFIKYNSSVINFANNEDNDNGNQRVLVSYDRVSKLLRAEYISRAKATVSQTDQPIYIHRLYHDETGGKLRVVSAIESGFTDGADTTGTSAEKYVVSGYFGTPLVALSIDLVGMDPSINGNYDACVNAETGVISTDPTLAGNDYDCGSATVNANKATAAFTAVDSLKGSLITSSPTTWWVLSTGAEVLSWSSIDDMLTTGL